MRHALALFLLTTAGLAGCATDPMALHVRWEVPFENAAFSSPLLVDLNEDGVLDVVAAEGPWPLMPNEADASWHELVALDGRNGHLIWTLEAGAVDASPATADLDGDGQPEILIGLRNQGVLGRIDDGQWGARLSLGNWVHSPAIADLDGDGTLEIVAVTGGLEPGDGDGHTHDHTHPNGGASGLPGEVLATDSNLNPLWRHPLRMEAYASPAVAQAAGLIFVGLGGEMHEGGYFEARHASNGTIAWDEPTHTGVVASPALLPDGAGVVFLEWWGGLHARSLAGQILWDQDTRHISMASPTLADLDGDGGSDIIVTGMSTPGLQLEQFEAGLNDKGALSTANSGVAIAYDAATGQERWRRTFAGSPGTPVTGDFDGDGLADVILVVTHGDRGVVATEGGTLLVLDGQTGDTMTSRTLPSGAVATPALSDLDGNGKADIVIATTAPAGVMRLTAQPTTIVEVAGSWPQWRGDSRNTGNPTP